MFHDEKSFGNYIHALHISSTSIMGAAIYFGPKTPLSATLVIRRDRLMPRVEGEDGSLGILWGKVTRTDDERNPEDQQKRTVNILPDEALLLKRNGPNVTFTCSTRYDIQHIRLS